MKINAFLLIFSNLLVWIRHNWLISSKLLLHQFYHISRCMLKWKWNYSKVNVRSIGTVFLSSSFFLPFFEKKDQYRKSLKVYRIRKACKRCDRFMGVSTEAINQIAHVDIGYLCPSFKLVLEVILGASLGVSKQQFWWIWG